MTPTPADLLAVMREVRDAASYSLNPHTRPCLSLSVQGGACNCTRARRLSAAWSAFHAALDRAGIPRLENG